VCISLLFCAYIDVAHASMHNHIARICSLSMHTPPRPVQGWRQLDPGTGDEAGTTEGSFDVEWKGHFFMGKNNAVATDHNVYLDGLGVRVC